MSNSLSPSETSPRTRGTVAVLTTGVPPPTRLLLIGHLAAVLPAAVTVGRQQRPLMLEAGEQQMLSKSYILNLVFGLVLKGHT